MKTWPIGVFTLAFVVGSFAAWTSDQVEALYKEIITSSDTSRSVEQYLKLQEAGIDWPNAEWYVGPMVLFCNLMIRNIVRFDPSLNHQVDAVTGDAGEAFQLSAKTNIRNISDQILDAEIAKLIPENIVMKAGSDILCSKPFLALYTGIERRLKFRTVSEAIAQALFMHLDTESWKFPYHINILNMSIKSELLDVWAHDFLQGVEAFKALDDSAILPLIYERLFDNQNYRIIRIKNAMLALLKWPEFDWNKISWKDAAKWIILDDIIVCQNHKLPLEWSYMEACATSKYVAIFEKNEVKIRNAPLRTEIIEEMLKKYVPNTPGTRIKKSCSEYFVLFLGAHKQNITFTDSDGATIRDNFTVITDEYQNMSEKLRQVFFFIYSDIMYSSEFPDPKNTLIHSTNRLFSCDKINLTFVLHAHIRFLETPNFDWSKLDLILSAKLLMIHAYINSPYYSDQPFHFNASKLEIIKTARQTISRVSHTDLNNVIGPYFNDMKTKKTQNSSLLFFSLLIIAGENKTNITNPDVTPTKIKEALMDIPEDKKRTSEHSQAGYDFMKNYFLLWAIDAELNNIGSTPITDVWQISTNNFGKMFEGSHHVALIQEALMQKPDLDFTNAPLSAVGETLMIDFYLTHADLLGITTQYYQNNLPPSDLSNVFWKHFLREAKKRINREPADDLNARIAHSYADVMNASKNEDVWIKSCNSFFSLLFIAQIRKIPVESVGTLEILTFLEELDEYLLKLPTESVIVYSMFKEEISVFELEGFGNKSLFDNNI